MNDKRRTSGRRVAIGLLVLIGTIVSTLLGVFWLTRDPYGPVVSVTAFGERAALVRRGHRSRGHYHVGVWDRRGPVWSTALFGVQPGRALLVDEGTLFVPALAARGHAQVYAFDAETGELRWRGPELAPPEPEWSGVALAVSERVLFDVHGASTVVVQVLDRATGELRGRATLQGGAGAHDLVVVEEALVIDPGTGSWWSVDASGAVDAAPAPEVWRRAGSGYVGPAGEPGVPVEAADEVFRGARSYVRRGEEVLRLDAAAQARVPGLVAVGASRDGVAVATEAGIALLDADLALVRVLEGEVDVVASGGE